MHEPFLDFQWGVSPAYHWQDWLDARGRRVVVRPRGLSGFDSPLAVDHAWKQNKDRKTGPVLGAVLDSGPPRQYAPMQREHAALFRNFADLDYKNLEKILAFATEYGLLGLDPQEQFGTVGRPEHYVSGESHLRWAREICLMREAVSSVETPTRAKASRPRLAWLFDQHLQQVQGRMVFKPEGSPRFTLAPQTLLASMWLQLTLSVAGDKQFVACKFCQRLFEISTEQTGFRSHREFCSGSCKTKDYRKRKRTALRLAASGTRLREISEKTGTETATVRGWLASAKRRPGTKSGGA